MKTRFLIVLCVGSLAFGDGLKASSDVITPRWGHTVTDLGNGRLLIAGGENESGLVAELESLDISFQPDLLFATDTIGSLSSPRRRHTAVLLEDGRVLVAGGEGASGVLDSAELIDPATGAVSEISLGIARADHTATLLADGRVLLAGGHDGVNSLASLQIFDPGTDTVSDDVDLAGARYGHTATRLDDGRVLLVGGRTNLGGIVTTEFWNTGTVTPGPDLDDARSGHTATTMQNGGVAVVGGRGGDNAPLATVEVFWSEPNTFISASSLTSPRAGHSAVVLPNNGHLMVLGGVSAEGPVAAVEVLHPYDFTFASQSPLDPPRSALAAAIVGPYVWVMGGKLAAGGATGSVSAVPFSTLASDRASYLASSTVTLQGDFWLPGEAVTITIVSSQDRRTALNSVADSNGRFLNTQFSTTTDDESYIATATGEQSGRRAALEFEKLIPTSFGGLSLSPAAITQTTDPVTLSILGSGFGVPVRSIRTYCRVHIFVCVKRYFVEEYEVVNAVQLRGTREDTNINVSLSPITATSTRLDVVLPLPVTSNIDHYFVGPIVRKQRFEWFEWPGGFVGDSFLQTWDEVNEFFGPFVVSPPDFTPPEITPTVDSSALVNGWYTGDVSIAWSVSDAESPISASSGCADTSVVTDTAGRTFSCSATSGGGTSTRSVTIKRDASPPDATIAVVGGTQGSNGWYVSPVTVRTTGSDDVSGPVGCTADQVQSADTTGSQFTGSCTNAANLTKEAAPLLIKVDKTAPTVSAAATTAPNAAGWYQGDVTVAFTCTDATSGIATCPANQTLSGQGASIASTPQVATDAAGRTSAPSNIVVVKIDRTVPTVALSGGPAHGGSYYFDQVPVTPACSGSDGLSGLESCTISGYGTTVGSHTVLATARDSAGNVSVQSATYTVLPWTLAGFHHPIEMGDVVNTVKGGSTVPITFEAFAGTTELVDPAAVIQPLKATQAVCGSADTNDIELIATGSTSLRYDAAAGLFIYNWKTPKMPGYCYVVTVTLKDGTSRSAQFGLK